MKNKRRPITLELERLEQRDMLSATPLANPPLLVVSHTASANPSDFVNLVGRLRVVPAYSEFGYGRRSSSPQPGATAFLLTTDQGTFELSFPSKGLAASAAKLNGHQVVVTGDEPTAHASVPVLSVTGIRQALPVQVTLQPASTTVAPGSAATFTAAASGYPTPAIQWQLSTNGGKTVTDSLGATGTDTLTFTAATSQNGNEYRAEFINTLGNVATKPATLHVIAPPLSNPVPPANPAASPATGPAAAMAAFATDLYGQLAGQQANFAFSPLSIELALAMVYAGASGQTAAEMASVLHLGPDTAATHTALAALAQQIEADGSAGGSTLNLANAVWGQTGFPFLPAFLQLLQNTYGAPLQKADFRDASDQAATAINNWVAQQTQNMIQQLFPPGSIDSSTRLVLANAMYFHGNWLQPFDPNATAPGNFSLGAGQTVSASMMHQTANFLYDDVNGAQMLELPYAGGKLAMDVLLPDQPAGLGQLESQLTAGNLATWTNGLAYANVAVTLPKFQMSSAFNLSSVLSAMGMPDAFNPSTADFSGMDGKTDLSISTVMHQAVVNVDETGTTAAAATGVGMTMNAVAVMLHPPIVFNADHPFVYMIRDTSTNTILFMGRVDDPSPSS
jgi:serpin B